MNHKQKFGYIVFGSLLTLTAMGIGALLAPPLTAQNNGVFDHIECKSLTVVNQHGAEAIALESEPTLNSPMIRIYNPDGTIGIVLATSDAASTIFVSGPDGLGVAIGAQKGGNTVGIMNPSGEKAINITAAAKNHTLAMKNPNGHDGLALYTGTQTYNSVTVFNNEGEAKTGIVATEDVGEIYTRDRQGNLNFHKP